MSNVRLPLAVAALTAAFSQISLAQTSPGQRFELASPDEQPLRDVPLATQPVTVVLKMAGDPVAVVRSRAPGKQISDSEQRSIEDQLRSEQDALHGLIEANGGTVLAKFQNAINGIKVQVPAEKLIAVATLPGVVDVKPVAVYTLDNSVSVPFIGAPAVWGGNPGFRGEHIRVAILDTGIDYTHANFGGPGTAAAYLAAHDSPGAGQPPAETQPANPALFGPAAPKVKGGIDLVGDDYNASAKLPNGQPDLARRTPHPDPNPLDCAFFKGQPAPNVGHGSHVAGTAAGFGVKADGTTFKGPYDKSTPGNAFRIGPGVAPLADLYAVRVFGCEGSTNVVVDALDWAVQHHIQVVNMSLGSPFGLADDASAEASTNAVNAGVVVVASAGNSGPNPYITGSPAAGEKAISVAAIDSTADFPGARLALSKAGTATTTISVQNNNNRSFTDRTSLSIVVLRNANASVSLGCDESEYVDAVITGKLVVALRGTCARIDRAIFGFRHHAAAVALINNASGRGVFEGDIFDGSTLVTIPFFGVQGVSQTVLHADATALINADTETQTAARVANPGFRKFASFSSGGPRNGDGHLKPDISAPGVSTVSTAAGSGNGAETLSGTSMASPHVAGVAALALQSHPGWGTEDVRAAIVNTADAGQLTAFSARVGGSGLVQPIGATRTSVIATAKGGATNLSFGVRQFSHDFTAEAEVDVRNLGSSTATFAVSSVPGEGSPHSVIVQPARISVSPGRREKLHVELRIPAATVGDASGFRDVSGAIALTPTGATGSTGAPLTVPYFVVTRARSQIEAELEGDVTRSTASVKLVNESGSVAGNADFYSLGLTGKNRKAGAVGLRAVGVQAFDDSRGRRTLVFAVNTFAPWSTAATKEFDILVDVDGDGKPDFDVFAADLNGDGSVLSAVFDLTNRKTLAVRFFAFAPTNGSTIEIPVRVSDLSSPTADPNAKPPILDACSGGKHCAVTKDTPRFTYAAQSFDFDNNNTDAIVDARGRFVTAPFNAFHSSISTGDFVDLAPGARATVPLTIDAAEFALTPALGQMVVSVDNFSGKKQANLLRIGGEKDDD